MFNVNFSYKYFNQNNNYKTSFIFLSIKFNPYLGGKGGRVVNVSSLAGLSGLGLKLIFRYLLSC